MYKSNRSHKEQVLRNKRITNSENALKKLYMNLLYSEREGTIKQEVFNIFFIKSFIISYPSAYLHSCFIVPKNFLIKKKKWAEQEILYLISR